jgi:hypothetical protein
MITVVAGIFIFYIYVMLQVFYPSFLSDNPNYHVISAICFIIVSFTSILLFMPKTFVKSVKYRSTRDNDPNTPIRRHSELGVVRTAWLSPKKR